MSGLEVRVDAADLARMANLIGAAGKMAPVAIARAVNHTGDKARTGMIRALTKQTGLKRKVIVKALKVTRAATGGSAGAGAATSVYVIRSRGGNVSLKYFGARETRRGVSAAPWGQRQVFTGTFIRGGHFPNRVAIPKLGGQVYERTGPGRMPIRKAKSGLYIPAEMVRGATAAAFQSIARTDLPDRLVHELLRVMLG